MKLLLAVLNHSDGPDICHGLEKAGFFVIRLSSYNGFFKAANPTILVRLEEEQIETALIIIRENAQSRLQMLPDAAETLKTTKKNHPNTDGTMIFILNVERFEKV